MLKIIFIWLAMASGPLMQPGLDLGELSIAALNKTGQGFFESADGRRLVINRQSVSDEADAKKIINDKKFFIDGLFERRTSTYRGALTKEIVCPTKGALPRSVQTDSPSGTRVVYQIWANDRYVYGGCDVDALKYKSISVFLYCKKQKEFFHIKYFDLKNTEDGKMKAFAEGIQCR